MNSTSQPFRIEFLVDDEVRVIIYSGLHLHSFYTSHPELLDEIKDKVVECVKTHTQGKEEELNKNRG